MAENNFQEPPKACPKIDPSLGGMSLGSRIGLGQQQSHETVLGAILERPKAVAWCVFAMFTLVVSSYTNTAGNSILGIPQFRKDFGHLVDGKYVLYANWQAAYYGGGFAAAVLGAFFAAWAADLFGRKAALGLLLAIKLVSIALEVAATTNAVYCAALILSGLTFGGFNGVVVTYISEVCPLRLRGILTAAVPLAICFGGLIVAILIKYTGEQRSRWAYRTTFVSQFGISGIAVVILPFMPESPWWLEQVGKHEQAVSVLLRLSYDDAEAHSQVCVISRTLINNNAEARHASYFECIQGTNLRRTIISIMPMSIQALSGVTFISYYSTYYQQLAGYSTQASFQLFMVQIVLSIFGIVCSLPLIDRVGRRNLTIWGMSFLTIALLITGALAVAGTKGAVKGTVALMLLYAYAYNLTIGATAYSLSAEVATARLRAKTASLTFALQGALFSMWGLVLPYLFNPDKANLGAKVTFIFGGLSILSTIYLWFYQPEVAGRSYEELDEMFRMRVPTRKFRTYRIHEEERDV